MVYAYLLVSLADPSQRYIGFTTDLKRRIASHNGGVSVHIGAPIRQEIPRDRERERRGRLGDVRSRVARSSWDFSLSDRDRVHP